MSVCAAELGDVADVNRNDSECESTFENVSTNGKPDIRDEQLAKIEVGVLAVILIITVIGNSFVLIALWRQARFCPKSRMYLFMKHLSLADLLVAAFAILPQMIWKITYRFRGGDFLCRAVKYMQVMVIYLSTYILVMMAVDRYCTICWTPSSYLHWNRLKVAKMLVAAAWTIALLLAIPQPILFRMTEIKGVLGGVRDCWMTLENSWETKAYVTWFVISAFLIPLFVLTFCYGVISYKIWSYVVREKHNVSINTRSTTNGPTERLKTPSSQPFPKQVQRCKRNQITQAKLKTIKLTLVVVASFILCWSPFCVTQLVMVYSPPKQISFVETIFVLLACLNSCTNPWIYLAFSESLLNHLRVCLGVGIGRLHDNASIGDEEPEPKPTNRQQHIDLVNVGAKVASTNSENI